VAGGRREKGRGQATKKGKIKSYRKETWNLSRGSQRQVGLQIHSLFLRDAGYQEHIDTGQEGHSPSGGLPCNHNCLKTSTSKTERPSERGVPRKEEQSSQYILCSLSCCLSLNLTSTATIMTVLSGSVSVPQIGKTPFQKASLCRWFTPVILATQEAEIRRIIV
jgi:hypothetical protein